MRPTIDSIRVKNEYFTTPFQSPSLTVRSFLDRRPVRFKNEEEGLNLKAAVQMGLNLPGLGSVWQSNCPF
jgi:hypothetical protein